MRDLSSIAISMLFILVKYSTACIRTANAGNPVITQPGGTVTTTTTAATTTTTQKMANDLCQRCMAADINFLMTDPNRPDSFDATSEAEANDPATGCARLMAVCAGPPGTVAFMQFNLNQGGPEENQELAQTIKAPLTCSAMGEWTYMGRVITAVDCEAAPAPGGK